MIYRPNGTKFKNYDSWENLKNSPYNYAKNGLLKYIMSDEIIRSENDVLCEIKSFFEDSIVFLLKYVDILKNFKNHHWKNR